MHLKNLKHASCAFSILCFIKKKKKTFMVNSLSVCLDLVCFQLINKTSLLLYCQCFYVLFYALCADNNPGQR